MSLEDCLNNIGLGNPVMQAARSSGSKLIHAIGITPEQGKMILKETQTLGSIVSKYVWPDISLNSIVGSNYHFVRFAGLSGTSAILMGAYCSYVLEDIKDPLEQMRSEAYADGAIRMHLWHAFAMMAMPLVHYPVLTGTLMTTGALIYSGSFYYYALTGKQRIRTYPTIGVFFLIAAWMSLIM
ncbi:transmembrane protein 256 homolog [Drosophila miranda]|uniref:transmembrane protein 256 homolog n=1 Tax=Drosophila miranda TaxID=7229 RepID=UPI0007E7C18C|nr:transmembrane protein 256 homolog [Drosophila miranda]